MTEVYGRFSIGCWIDPNSTGPNDDEAYFDDRIKMEQEAKRLLRAGRFKYIALYEWNAAKGGWDDIDELTADDVDE